MLRLTAYALAVTAAILMWFVLPDIYREAAQTPNDLTGQVVAINNHGNIIYVTQSDNIVRIAILPLVFASIAVGAWSFIAERGKSNAKE